MSGFFRGMPRVSPAGLVVVVLLALVLAGCRREAEVAGGTVDAGTTPGTEAPPPSDTAPVVLEDVMESDARYIIGISYPPGINRYPVLAAELKRYADAARSDLMEAVAAHDPSDGASGGVPYDLALPFDMVVETPDVVAVQATGTSYTGGAHGNPLVARFVWLPRRNEMLTAEALLRDDAGWEQVAAYVRESLHSALSQRLDADEVGSEDRMRLMRTGGGMIEEGTEPSAANFAHFEPVPGGDGRLRALRFVFPPYQVGPYSDGVQTVEVPASVLQPLVAPEYRELFAAG